MRVHWLLPTLLGAIGTLVFSLPAEAARLQLWRFDQNSNRLTFSTDEQVQPRAQLISNPTRLVIDLPDTIFGRSQVEQSLDGAIRSIRVAQFDASTTRIVIEMSPGYTLDPQQVSVRGTSPTQWVVQLPAPQSETGSAETGDTNSTQTTEARTNRTETNQTVTSRTESNRTGTNRTEVSRSEAAPVRPIYADRSRNSSSEAEPAAVQVEDLQITPDGFFVRTTGEIDDIDQDNDNRPPQFTLEIKDAVLSPAVVQRSIDVNQYGVEQIELTQVEVDAGDQPEVQIVLRLADNASNWRARTNDRGGIALTPRRGRVLTGNRETRSLTTATAAASTATPPLPVPNQSIPTPIPAGSSAPSRASVPLPDVSHTGIVIAIDPGHGGRDPGAVGIDGLQEAGIVLDIAEKVAALLDRQGVQVVLTRQNDSEIDLEPRVQTAERSRADLFVSIHANSISLDRPDVNGIETYYYSDSGERLAQVIHSAVVRGTGSSDRGVRFARFYVLRRTSMPAVLVEVGFVTGARDAANLSDADYREKMAESIAAGILQYVQQNF